MTYSTIWLSLLVNAALGLLTLGTVVTGAVTCNCGQPCDAAVVAVITLWASLSLAALVAAIVKEMRA
jgi:hypothetical protein